VVTPYFPTASETFIRAHIEGLPAKSTLIHGWRPTVGDQKVLSAATRMAFRVGRLFKQDRDLETTTAYLKAFNTYQASAVLAEYGPTGVRTKDACVRLGLPLIVHFHGFDASVYEVLEENAESYPVMFQQASAVIAVSKAMQAKLISLGAPPEKVHYNPYGIDCERFYGARPDFADPVFLAVGRFVDKKAPQITISAFAQVLENCPAARLRMIGDGPLLDECQQLVAKLGIAHAVEFLGLQPPEVVQNEMRAARCFVQHSVQAENGDCEGTPVGILEAGASGLPVISTRHAGIPDVVIEGKTGFLVDEKDENGMAAHMSRLADDARLAAKLGLEARSWISTEFSRKKRIEKLWAIIKSCIDQTKSSSNT
jgi:colanic acid/amylovoran biosynthesis glycosyltransferase